MMVYVTNLLMATFAHVDKDSKENCAKVCPQSFVKLKNRYIKICIGLSFVFSKVWEMQMLYMAVCLHQTFSFYFLQNIIDNICS